MNTLKKFLYSVLTAILLGFLIMNTKAIAETRYQITLDHEMPETTQGLGYRYVPVIEKAYIVAPHIVMTLDVASGHFPDDAVISGTDIKVWLYMVDWNRGIKVFLVEEAVEVSERACLPAWVVELYSVVAEELEKDGGWELKIGRLKMDENFRNEPEPETEEVPVWKIEL